METLGLRGGWVVPTALWAWPARVASRCSLSVTLTCYTRITHTICSGGLVMELLEGDKIKVKDVKKQCYEWTWAIRKQNHKQLWAKSIVQNVSLNLTSIERKEPGQATDTVNLTSIIEQQWQGSQNRKRYSTRLQMVTSSFPVIKFCPSNLLRVNLNTTSAKPTCNTQHPFTSTMLSIIY